MRQKDVSKPMHSGNVEYYGEYSEDKTGLQEIADKLNEEEKV